MFTFVLCLQAIVAAVLVGFILVQKSEGGGLGTGGSPSGLMSARGAADFLTRATAVLATAFILLSILLAVLASVRHSTGAIDTSLARHAPIAPISQQPGGPPEQGALSGAAASAAAAGNSAAPASNGGVPLQQ